LLIRSCNGPVGSSPTTRASTIAIYKEKSLSKPITLDQVIELAKIADSEPIDFGMIEIDEETVYTKIALAAIDGFNKTEAETRDIVYLASVINLHVKNYVLNMEKHQLHATVARLIKQLEKLKK
jgi:hypothetical protein